MDKVRQSILYIIAKNRTIKQTKLHKTLYYANVEFLRSHHKLIFDDIFIKNYNGPTLKRLDNLIDELKTKHLLSVRKKESFNDDIGDYVNSYIYKTTQKTEQNINDLSDDEIKSIDKAMAFVSPMSAKEISEHSHNKYYNSIRLKSKMSPYGELFNNKLTDDEVNALLKDI